MKLGKHYAFLNENFFYEQNVNLLNVFNANGYSKNITYKIKFLVHMKPMRFFRIKNSKEKNTITEAILIHFLKAYNHHKYQACT